MFTLLKTFKNQILIITTGTFLVLFFQNCQPSKVNFSQNSKLMKHLSLSLTGTSVNPSDCKNGLKITVSTNSHADDILLAEAPYSFDGGKSWGIDNFVIIMKSASLTVGQILVKDSEGAVVANSNSYTVDTVLCNLIQLPDSSQSCNASLGYYCPSGSLIPLVCSEGSFCPPGSTTQTPCEASSYCPNPSTQLPCPANLTSIAGQTKCTSTLCTSSAGSFCQSGSTTGSPCSLNNYCPAGSTSQTLCPAGSYCPNPATIFQCPAGNYCPSGSTAPTQCPAGYYCPVGTIDYHANPCADGNYCPAGSINQTLCSAGFFCPDSMTQNSCLAGTTSVAGQITCTAISPTLACVASAGNFCSPGATTETQCTQTNYCPSGATTQTYCQAGFYCSTPATQVQCPAGKYCPAGTVNPIVCPAGYYCPAGSSNYTSTPCSIGNFCPMGSSSQTLCLAGSYCPDTSTQKSCTLGNYCPQGSISQSLCLANHFCPDTSTQSACLAGTNSIAGQTSCSTITCTALAGSYCSSGSNIQTTCTAGNYCPAGSTAPSQCLAGNYCPDPKTQLPCPSGYYCPSGTISYTANLCPAGYYCPSGTPSNTSNQCPAGYFCPSGSSTYYSCSSATNNYYCPSGSSSITQYSCTSGQIPNGDKSSCIAGLTCTLPWGGQINNGESVYAWLESKPKPGYRSSCMGLQRTCNSGTLTGDSNYATSSCDEYLPCDFTSFGGTHNAYDLKSLQPAKTDKFCQGSPFFNGNTDAYNKVSFSFAVNGTQLKDSNSGDPYTPYFKLSDVNKASVVIVFNFNDSTNYNYLILTSKVCNDGTGHFYAPPLANIGATPFNSSMSSGINFISIDDGGISSNCTYRIFLNWWKVGSSSVTQIDNVYNYQGDVSKINMGADASSKILTIFVSP